MFALARLYERHEHVALLFSGGRDSLACLHLARPYWDRTTVIWVNTQAVFPEIKDVMRTIRELVPRFHEVRADQPASIVRSGFPADVVPVDWTPFGQACTSTKPIKIRPYTECCAENLSMPGDQAARDLGCTAIIRGQRADEAHRGPATNGFVHEGVEYCHPIEGWSADDVLAYLREQGCEITERLSMPHSSLDCWSCTAFAADSAPRLEYIRRHYPDRYPAIKGWMRVVRNAAAKELQALDRLLED
ncbi:MAG: phosphoadenosine phosphosulfate reductase family protein [Burkholderiaceae bacterium]